MVVKKSLPKSGGELKLEIPAPNIRSMKVKVNGTSPVISHKWSEKAKKQILDKQMKKPEANKREPRDPEGEFRSSFYLTKEGCVAFPANNIKQGIVGAARNLEGVTMTLLRGAVFIVGDADGLIPLLHDNKPIKLGKTVKFHDAGGRTSEFLIGYDTNNPYVEVRQDMVRVMGGGADIRFRGQVRDWTMDIMVKFNADVISAEQVINLLNIAGFSCGLGEWRPEKNGDFGTFSVQSSSSMTQ